MTNHIEYQQPVSNKFLFSGLLVYTIMFYSQLAARFMILESLRLELVIGSILILFALGKIFKGDIDFRENKLNLAALLFLLSALITIPFAVWITNSYNMFIRLLKFFAIYMMIIAAIDTEKKLKVFMFVYLSMTCLLFVEPFLLSLDGKGFVFNNHMMRLAGVTGYFAHPNQLAGITSANLPFFYYILKHEKSKLLKISCSVLIVIAIRVVMLTQSRTGFVGVMAFGLVVWVYSAKKMLSFVAIILAAAMIWSFAPQETKDRFMTFRDTGKVISGEYTEEETGSLAARWTLVKHAFVVFLENPIIGVGLDNFRVVSFRKWNRYMPPHNTYLEALSEMGIIGFAAFVYVIVITFRNLLESQKIINEVNEKSDFLAYTTSALTLYLILRLVVSLFGQELYDNYWWMVGGLSVVTLRILRNRRKAEAMALQRVT